MISAEPETMPEKVPFSQSVMIFPEVILYFIIFIKSVKYFTYLQDKVENWLTKIQEMMIKTLYDLTKQAVSEYPVNELERKEFI